MEQLFMIFPERMRKALLRAELSIERLQEIRLRVGRPVLLRYSGTEYGLTKDGHLTDSVDSAGIVPSGRGAFAGAGICFRLFCVCIL
ncbi:MAG: hypothetical protein ACLTSZ_06335 [Lachnospiraceae bacterium]